MPRLLSEIIRESARLALVFGGLGLTAIVFVHAEGGVPFGKRELSPAGAVFLLQKGNGDDFSAARSAAEENEPNSEAAAPLPERVLIDAPFTPQAPYGSWRDPYNEACEEASVIMARAWADGLTAIEPGRADREIKSLVLFEKYYFGYYRDTAARETAKMLTKFYGYPGVRVRYGIGLPDIKNELARGRIVILPTLGSALENPYFSDLPPYHMIVAVGYDDASGELIANDPGTRRGRQFRYPYRVMENALHDWPGSEQGLARARSAMIVVYPKNQQPL